MESRYIRQETFYGIGKRGQAELAKSRIAIIGQGALGTMASDRMTRAGVGFIRIVDLDKLDITNIQRQVLYTEEDAKNAVPKAEAAARHLREINSEIEIEAITGSFDASTAGSIISDVDLVIDATDNLKTRYLINEACRVLKKNWIYGGAVGGMGMTYNFIYGEDRPCFNCVMDYSLDDGKSPTAKEAGILNTATAIVSSLECTEAIKILTHADNVRETMIYFDLWKNKFEEINIEKDPDCEVCVKKNYRLFIPEE